MIKLLGDFSGSIQMPNGFLGQNLPKKGFFLVQNRKSEYGHRIQLIRISLVTKFQLKETVSFLWTKFTRTGNSQHKKEKAKIIKFSTFQLVFVPSFNLNNFDFWTKFSKKGYSALKKKN